jgi:hypothetical protein
MMIVDPRSILVRERPIILVPGSCIRGKPSPNTFFARGRTFQPLLGAAILPEKLSAGMLTMLTRLWHPGSISSGYCTLVLDNVAHAVTTMCGSYEFTKLQTAKYVI